VLGVAAGVGVGRGVAGLGGHRVVADGVLDVGDEKVGAGAGEAVFDEEAVGLGLVECGLGE